MWDSRSNGHVADGCRFCPVALTAVLAFTILLLAGGCDTEQRSDRGFDNWDADDDLVINGAEFAEMVTGLGLFSRWDQNGDSAIVLQEFVDRSFTLWDDDGNSSIDGEEWASAMREWDVPPGLYGTFDDWDRNDNERISKQEFRYYFADRGMMDEWDDDGDGQIDENEFISNYMEVWDDDGDGDLTDEEWQSSADLLP